MHTLPGVVVVIDRKRDSMAARKDGVQEFLPRLQTFSGEAREMDARRIVATLTSSQMTRN